MKYNKINLMLLLAICVLFSAGCTHSPGYNYEEENGNSNSSGNNEEPNINNDGSSKSKAILLAENIWIDGNIKIPNGESWYSFEADAGTAYSVWLNESYYGDGTKTANVQVIAYDENGTELFNESSAWETPQYINLNTSSIIYLKVTGSGIGTFAIGYSTDGKRDDLRIKLPANPTELIKRQWKNGDIKESVDEIWYSFNVTANTSYTVWWNDDSAGDNTKTLDIQVKVYDDEGNLLFNEDEGWASLNTINVFKDGTIYLRVRAKNNGYTGTFGILYGEGFVRPGLSFTPLTENIWADGNIRVPNGESWYSFDADAEIAYYVWWNDSYYGDDTKTADVQVIAYDENRTELFNESSAWGTPKNINLISSSTIYLRVISRGVGTFSVVYSTENEKPE